jgi:hypothetical protein
MRETDSGDLWIRHHGPFDKGFVYRGHRHWVDHNSFVHEGTEISVKYRHQKNGPIVLEKKYLGPCRFLVAAGLFHEIEILSEFGEWDCEFKKPVENSALLDVFNQELLD